MVGVTIMLVQPIKKPLQLRLRNLQPYSKFDKAADQDVPFLHGHPINQGK